ncbi:MAG: hypothetical protein RL497_1285 [Pseudomonadota bacterium]|jgi:putative ABC transport system permease protein
MIDWDKWQEIYLTLKKHKLRTSLTAFGVFWGIFMLVVLLGAGNGLKNGVVGMFGGQSNTVYMWSGTPTQIPYAGMQKGRKLALKDEDLAAIRQGCPELDVLTGNNDLGHWQGAQYVVRGEKFGAFPTKGTQPANAKLKAYSTQLGRYINAMDIDEKRKVAVIGTRVQETLFNPDENPIGQSIEIRGIYFLVVGVFKGPKTGDNAQEAAETVLIPNSTLRYTFNQLGWIGHIELTPKPGFDAVALEEKVKKIIMERNRVHPDDMGVVGSFNVQKEFNKFMDLFAGITAFSWAVAIGTLFAGAIGVGNIMLIVVKERTKEIGVRKAIGATSASIVAMVIQEALVITLFAGYWGLAVAVFLLESITKLLGDGNGGMFSNPEINLSTAFIAMAILVVAALFAALLPASKAAGVNPIVALQDE